MEKARELGSGKSEESSLQEQHPQKNIIGQPIKIQATFVRKLNGLKNKIIIAYAHMPNRIINFARWAKNWKLKDSPGEKRSAFSAHFTGT